MAMKVEMGPTADGGEGGDPHIVAEINVTPLVDVFLLLLVIFMVTSSVMTQMNIQVQLPQSQQAADKPKESSGIIVTVNSDSEIFVNAQRVPEGALGQMLHTALERSADKTVILEGDRRAVLETIVHVMDEGKKAGALKFAVATKGGQ